MKKLYTILLLLATAVSAWAFEVGDLSYDVKASPSGNNPGTVTCTGLSTAGKAKTNLDLTIPAYITYNGNGYNVTVIGEDAFTYQKGIKTVKINHGITEIKSYAFRNCTSMTSVDIPHSVTSIGYWSFAYCTELERIDIPISCTNVNPLFVDGCTSLSFIGVWGQNPYYSSEHGCLYDKNQTKLIRVPEGYPNSTVYFPRNTIKEIGGYAFYNVKALERIIIPYGVTTIGAGAFRDCTGLEVVKIPSSVTDIAVGKIFYNCPSLASLYINLNNPPTITKSSAFYGAGNPDIYIPRNLEDTYTSAGWTGFKSVNKNNRVAYDEYDNNMLSYSIHSTKPEEINGTTYDGRAKVVRSWNYENFGNEQTVPAYITLQDKKYAVTCIDDYAVGCTNSLSLKGCELVDTVGKKAFDGTKITSIELPYVSLIDEEAFDDCRSLTSAKWGNRLKRINKWGFCNAPLEHDLILPVGFEYLGYQAFKEVKSKMILVPSTLQSCDKLCFNRMENTTTFIINTPRAFQSSWTFDFDQVPTSATIYVPYNEYASAKTHDSWKRFSNIKMGAFDFSYGASFSNIYTMTVISNEPVTVDGVTYAGKAKYVYNPRISSLKPTSFTPDNSEVDKMCGGSRSYLMTEIDRNLAFSSSIETCDFTRMKNLEYIGRAAFAYSNLKTATMPARKITFGESAFTNADQLTELVIPYNSLAWEGRFFGANADDFQCYVNNNNLADLLNKLSTHTYNDDEKCSDRLAPCFTAQATTFNMGVLVPLDLSGHKAYAVVGVNGDGTLHAERWYRANTVEQGLIFTDLTKGTLYKVKRLANPGVTNTNYLEGNTGTSIYNVYNSGMNLYWDTDSKKFIRPTSAYFVTSGRSYLHIDSNADELYLDLFPPEPQGSTGDVNGDGTVDITDVNLTINVMLGKATKTQYPAADVNGDGTVDITDVNLIINVMLGK